jgi:hypothetical protein
MYTTGFRVERGQFSRDVVGVIVGEYGYLTEQLSDRRWHNITTLCVGEEKPKVTTINRRAMYVPSSPMKGSDGE